MLTSDPLMARPIGERAVETMTASGMTITFPNIQIQVRARLEKRLASKTVIGPTRRASTNLAVTHRSV